MMGEMVTLYGGFGSGFDIAMLIFFLAVAVIYLIIPVIGYHPDHRRGIAAAMYALIGYAVASLIQPVAILLMTVDSGGGIGRGLGGAFIEEFILPLFLIVSILKLACFLTAMITFVVGLRSVRLRPTSADVPHDV